MNKHKNFTTIKRWHQYLATGLVLFGVCSIISGCGPQEEGSKDAEAALANIYNDLKMGNYQEVCDQSSDNANAVMQEIAKEINSRKKKISCAESYKTVFKFNGLESAFNKIKVIDSQGSGNRITVITKFKGKFRGVKMILEDGQWKLDEYY